MGIFNYIACASLNMGVYLGKQGCFCDLGLFSAFYLLNFLCNFHDAAVGVLWLFEVLM